MLTPLFTLWLAADQATQSADQANYNSTYAQYTNATSAVNDAQAKVDTAQSKVYGDQGDEFNAGCTSGGRSLSRSSMARTRSSELCLPRPLRSESSSSSPKVSRCPDVRRDIAMAHRNEPGAGYLGSRWRAYG